MGIVLLDGQEINYSDDWSFKSFVNKDLKDASTLHDVVIYSSQFYWEKPNHNPFPSSANNITFIKCNLDNLVLPPNSTVIECSQKKFQSQNDLNDWEIDADGNPTRPMNWEVFVDLGLPIPKPADIPSIPASAPIDLLAIARGDD